VANDGAAGARQETGGVVSWKDWQSNLVGLVYAMEEYRRAAWANPLWDWDEFLRKLYWERCQLTTAMVIEGDQQTAAALADEAQLLAAWVNDLGAWLGSQLKAPKELGEVVR